MYSEHNKQIEELIKNEYKDIYLPEHLLIFYWLDNMENTTANLIFPR